MVGLASDFLTIPHRERYVLTRGRIPRALAPMDHSFSTLSFPGDPDLVAADLLIVDGQVSDIDVTGAFDGEIALVDVEDSLVLPAFTDMHTHLDKGHIWPREPNPDGTFEGALNSVRADCSSHWSAEDVRARMAFSLECAYAHGTRSVRTHIDSLPPQHEISWPVFAEMRELWADRITLQAVSLNGIDGLIDDAARTLAHDTARKHGGIPGAVTYMIPELQETLSKIFHEAMDAGTDLDFHVDETLDPEARSLESIADTAIAMGFEGKVTCGHCCSLSTQNESDVDRTLDKVAQAGMTIVSLPLCNLYLQDRRAADADPRTPRRRGVTLLHEMNSRGIAVAIASDNTRDPFYAYGDLDMVEVYREATRIAHLDHPIDDWIKSVTAAPADTMGLPGAFEIGKPADLVILRARTFNEFFSRPQSDRVVIRNGQAIERSLPDYRTLDHLFKD